MKSEPWPIDAMRVVTVQVTFRSKDAIMTAVHAGGQLKLMKLGLKSRDQPQRPGQRLGRTRRSSTRTFPCPRRRLPQATLGFTLLELLIAVVAFGIVLAAINTVFMPHFDSATDRLNLWNNQGNCSRAGDYEERLVERRPSWWHAAGTAPNRLHYERCRWPIEAGILYIGRPDRPHIALG
jgi:prepilin-type N-terminal cleavage/methylation domain-containing protein